MLQRYLSATDLESKLETAVRTGNTSDVEELLKQGVNINARFPTGLGLSLGMDSSGTALDLVILSQNVGMVQLLLANGANPSVSRSLSLAVEKSDKDLVLSVARAFTESDKKHKEYAQAILLALRDKKLEIARELILAGADYADDSIENAPYSLYLPIVIQKNYLDIAQACMEKNMSPNARLDLQSERGIRSFAISYINFYGIGYGRKLGEYPLVADSVKVISAFAYVVMNSAKMPGLGGLIKLLKDHGADITDSCIWQSQELTDRGSEEVRASILELSTPCSSEICELLFAQPSVARLQENHRQALNRHLCWAAAAGNIEIFNQLLDNGAAVTATVDGQNLWQIAAIKRRGNIIKQLINLPAVLRNEVLPLINNSHNNHRASTNAFENAIQVGAFTIVCSLLAVGAWARVDPLQLHQQAPAPNQAPDRWFAFEMGNLLHYSSTMLYSDYWHRIGYSFSKFLIKELDKIGKLCGKYIKDPVDANQAQNEQKIQEAHAELWSWANQIYHQENLQAMRKSPERGFADSELKEQSKLTPQDIRKAIIGFYQYHIIKKLENNPAERQKAVTELVQKFVDDYFLPQHEDIQKLPPASARHRLRQVCLDGIAAVTHPLPKERALLGGEMPNAVTKFTNLVLHSKTTGVVSIPTTANIANQVDALPPHIQEDVDSRRKKVTQLSERMS